MKTVLIANRGEIALRILRACHAEGFRAAVVYSEADREAPYIAAADVAVCIGPGPVEQSYLDQGAILMAASAVSADAIHPGYGFLSENAAFAQAVDECGIIFIGPTAETIRLMGDKVAAKRAMSCSGIPCVPGSEGCIPPDLKVCHELAEGIGYPVIIKAAAGGGGRGMRVVKEPKELENAIRITGEEVGRAFGSKDLYLEKFLESPRHIEIQIVSDSYGNAVWLGERDCSIQRRHQKLVEEAPAPGIDRRKLSELGDRCVVACKKLGYRGVGTFEFLYEDGVFFFIEMNTRIQVEHPVTEAVTGIDIVREQIKIAFGEKLSVEQADVKVEGHAIECRINAEDPLTGMPSPGYVTLWHAPGGSSVRVDTFLNSGVHVPPFYDNLVAKVIVHARNRSVAIDQMRRALRQIVVKGIETNVATHLKILADKDFNSGNFSIHHFENRIDGD